MIIKIIFKIFIIIFFGIINFQNNNNNNNLFVLSQSQLSSKEYNCLVTLATKTNTLSKITYNSTYSYYDFCNYNTNFYVSCTGNSTTRLDIKSQSTASLSGSDFICYDKLYYVELEDSVIASDFFTSTWPLSVYEIDVTSNSTTGIPFGKPTTNLKYARYYIDKQPTTTIYFSWFYTTSWFQIYPGFGFTPTSTSHLIYFENDLTINQIWKPNLFDIISMNFPSFNNVKGYITITLLPSFDKTSLYDNIVTCKNITILRISSKDNSGTLFPSKLGQIVSSQFSSLSFVMTFLTPTSMIDISNLKTLYSITFQNVGRSFSFNGKIPFIFPKSLTSLYFSDGSITTLNLSDYNITNLQSLTLSNNSMGGSIPAVWDSSSTIQYLDLSNNKLTGTIDKSYCKMNLYISNNNLSGSIPSCFTCFFSSSGTIMDNYKNYFSGNQFSNFDNPPPCTTIIPNLVLDNSYVGDYEQGFYIFGQDLGNSMISDYMYITTDDGQYFYDWNFIIPNTLISFYYYKDPNQAMPKTLQLVYPSPLPTFTLAVFPVQPQISNVSWIGSDLIFSGSYFTYNSTIIDIDIGGYSKCLIKSTTFFEMKCQVSGIPVDATDILTIIKIGDLSTQTTLVQNIMNYVLNCTSTCNNNGYCNTRLSKCICSSNYQGSDCSLNFKQCPIYNNQLCNGVGGSCNNQTGVCTCLPSFQGNDCSLNYKQCPIYNSQVCNGVGGSCNNQTGVCTCTSNYQGSECSLNFKQCQSFNNQLCNGAAGSCNNQTGICTCIPSFQGNDCSLNFKQCPMFNNKLCNGVAGSCNNQTGVCSCTSSFQGSDCSIPFKQCPIYNTQLCNGAAGSCNNQTGICTCIPSFQGDSCSLPFIECKNDCLNLGLCNNQTGICSCFDKYSISPDCSPIECLDPLCSGNGKCNKSIGKCQCSINPHGYDGINCTIPLHSISSINPSSTNGGNCSINGWFGNVHDNPKVLIGNENCPILSINESTIICNAPPGVGLKSITVTQNSIDVPSLNSYRYYVSTKNCLVYNDCTSPNNGKCNTITGFCECINNWYGPDCSLLSGNNNNANGGAGSGDKDGSNENVNLPNSNTTIDLNSGKTNINNQQTNFQLSISSLLEIDIYGNTVYNYQLPESWETLTNKSKTVDGNTIYRFIQKIGNKNSTIIFTIEEVLEKKQFSFAGVEFYVDGGSVKMTVSIENYEYSNNLNTLQLQMKSSVNILSNVQDTNNCNNENVEIDSIDNDDSLNYISIKKNGKVLNGRFIDHVVSDGRTTFMSTTLVSKSNDSIIVGMNLPHCQLCSLDPDFSVLISTDFISNCNKSSKKPWLIPIAVIIPVVSVFAIGAAIFVLYQKNRIDPILKKMIELNNQKKY